jgi:hypothetical protein
MVVCIHLGAGASEAKEEEEEAKQCLIGEVRRHRSFHCATCGLGHVRGCLLKN